MTDHDRIAQVVGMLLDLTEEERDAVLMEFVEDYQRAQILTEHETTLLKVEAERFQSALTARRPIGDDRVPRSQ